MLENSLPADISKALICSRNPLMWLVPKHPPKPQKFWKKAEHKGRRKAKLDSERTSNCPYAH